MGVHANAKLGPAGRRELVRLIREGAPERQAAACRLAAITADRWSVREREASCEQRASGAWALDRSSRPRCCARRTDAETERRVCPRARATGPGIDAVTEYFLVGSFASWLIALAGSRPHRGLTLSAESAAAAEPPS